MEAEGENISGSLALLSSSSSVSILETHNQRIHEKLSCQNIEEIKTLFHEAPHKKFNYTQFRDLLAKYDIFFSDESYRDLFMKINTGREESVDWEKFNSYLIICFQQDDPYNQKETLLEPISQVPVTKKSEHRHPIVCLGFAPLVLPDRSTVDRQGSYISATKDGSIHFLSQDLEVQRTGKSKNPYYKISKTWILAIAALPDVRVLCTGSIERDLRFYDTTASNFHLRIIIKNLSYAVGCLHYTFNESYKVTCKLVMGDYGGNVRVIEFYPELRGPFQSKPGTALVEVTWDDVLAGKIPKMKVQEFRGVFNEIVRQVAHCEDYGLVFAAAECRASTLEKNKSLVAVDLGITNVETPFYTPKGITTFDVDQKNSVLATGGVDCLVRLWNPFAPEKPSATLTGHHAGIVYIFIQSDENKVYSLDLKKIIKIWDISEHNLLQTYTNLSLYLPQEMPFCCFYNHIKHKLIVADRKYVVLKCCPKMRLDLSDGATHSKAISVVLYNDLFKSILTCGLDSCIINWDPWTGKRLLLTKKAHTRTLHGELLKIEITAACFNPSKHQLLTGARDGSLKIWNFNSGTCIRNLNIEHMCEVTTVFWVPDRILAMGWNRHVTEFADIDGVHHWDPKNWATLHKEDILCASVSGSKILATGSYLGEIILWLLETGQPYHRFDAENPESQIKLKSEKKYHEKLDELEVHSEKLSNVSKRLSQPKMEELSRFGKDKEEKSALTLFKPAKFSPTAGKYMFTVGSQKLVGAREPRRLSETKPPFKQHFAYPHAVKSILLLESRKISQENGTLFAALGCGMIQVYSHHQLGGFLQQFKAVHIHGDSVMTMATDSENKYIFTGTSRGYIKVWLLTNFCVSEEEKVHVSLPRLRLQFPFLLKDRILGRAKRAVRKEPAPMLLNSFQGHIGSITSLVFIAQSNIIISGSTDLSVRIWSLGGQYIGTFGSPLKWETLSPNETSENVHNYRLPPDIQKVASSTTLKVLSGAKKEDSNYLIFKGERDESLETIESVNRAVYGEPLTDPLLGKNFRLPPSGKLHPEPVLDKTLPHIPVYTHLEIHPADPIIRPRTPEILKKARDLEFMNE